MNIPTNLLLASILLATILPSWAQNLVASFNEGALSYTGAGPAGTPTTWTNNSFIGPVTDPGSGLSYRLVSGWSFGIAINSGGANFASPMTNTFSVGDSIGVFEVSGLDAAKFYDFYLISGNAEGYGADNVYGGIHVVTTGNGGSASATGGTQADTDWVEGSNFAVIPTVIPDASGVVQISTTPNPASPNPAAFSIGAIQVVEVVPPAGSSPLDRPGSVFYGTLDLGSGETSTMVVGTAGDLVAVLSNDGFSVSTTHTINLVPEPLLLPGTYTLINYEGTIGGAGFAGLQLGKTGRMDATLVNNVANSSLDISVTDYLEADLVWEGDGVSGIWDEGSAATWDNSGDPDVFFEGDLVTFDDFASFPGTVNILGTVRPLDVLVVNSTSSYTFAGDTIISSGVLEKTGTGTLILLNSNTFGDGLLVDDGTVLIGDGSMGSFDGDLAVLAPGVAEFNQPDGVRYSGEFTGDGIVVKSGDFTLELGVASATFSGTVEIKAGILELNAEQSLDSANIEIASGGTLKVNRVNALQGGVGAGAGAIMIRSGGILDLASGSTSNIDSKLTLEGGGTLTGISPDALYGSWTINNAAASAAAAPTLFVAGGSGAATISAELLTLQPVDRNLVLDVADVTGDPDADLVMTGRIGNDSHRAFGLTIQGAGTVLLGGVNTYTGDTTVDSGRLVLAPGATLSFSIGADGINNQVNGSGTATFEGNFNLGLSGADRTPGNSWLLVDVATLSESFDASTFSVLGFNESAGIHSLDDGTSLWTFNEATGELSVAASAGGTPFERWLDGYPSLTGADREPAADPDRDGSPNIIEFVTGGDPTVSDPENLPQGEIVGDDFVFSFTRPAEILGSGVTVTIEVGRTLASWPDVYTVGADTASSSPGVTVAENGPAPDTITLTLPLAGDLVRFARLSAAE